MDQEYPRFDKQRNVDKGPILRTPSVSIRHCRSRSPWCWNLGLRLTPETRLRRRVSNNPMVPEAGTADKIMLDGELDIHRDRSRCATTGEWVLLRHLHVAVHRGHPDATTGKPIRHSTASGNWTDLHKQIQYEIRLTLVKCIVHCNEKN